MIDFLRIEERVIKKELVEIRPKFVVKTSSDLMIRGGDFYAVWIEERGLWSTDEQDVIDLVDREVKRIYDKRKPENEDQGIHTYASYMWDADSGIIDKWHKYCQKQMRDNFHMLDEKLVFSNTQTKKEDYASKKLNYPLDTGEPEAWIKLISTLYSEEEREKIEWAIGSIVCGESKNIQKFIVLYGAAGTGKSTVLNIIQKLFDGYYSVFDAKALGSSSNSFALEAFKSNPLVAIQHDGDLSKIEDNTRLNSLVSHELMTVNEKFKSTYSNRFKAFLFMGTNKPVKITDAKSGLIRRLIDVSPSGNKLSPSEYKTVMSLIDFELGRIANYCKGVYLSNPDRYDNYIPTAMLGASNDFYNFVIDSYHIFLKEDGTTLKAAWEMYKVYCDEAKVPYPLSQRSFKEELKNYFWEYRDRFALDDGSRVRSYYVGFRTDKFKNNSDIQNEKSVMKLIEFNSTESVFDKICANCTAQYSSVEDGSRPSFKWENVTSKLSDLDTSKLHYVLIPENHIVIDFDIPGEDGDKDFEKNLKAASKWPPTYAELSKSGKGIHLHYIYTGDPSKLKRLYDEHIEVKVFTGLSSLRRKLTKCNDLPIATISSGLPLKGEDKLINFESIQSEKGLRTLIARNLNKEIHPGTKPSVDFIYKILEDAYNDGLHYDVTDMRNNVYIFASGSTHHAEYCMRLVDDMKFKSDEASIGLDNEDAKLVFYDVEVFPNLLLVNWKIRGEGKPVVRMINPSPAEIEELFYYRLVGFNCRRYDNHILYGRYIGYDNEQIYQLSQDIIGGDREAFFGEAYNISYTDVYDFASAGNKKSLKKFEIELGIHHQELGLPWNKPVPEERWLEVAEYCDNDVIATEKVFEHLKGDWTARQILADLAEGSVNDTTNMLTTKIIFGNIRNTKNDLRYRNLAEPILDLDIETHEFLANAFPEMMAETHGEAESALPYFPGYKYDAGKSTYRGEEIGEGGRVYAEPGMYGNVALLDVASMHPTSVITECLFGLEFTRRFKEIVDGRVNIKHESWDIVNQMLDGKLTPYVQKVIDGEMTSKGLANALKTAINSVYGLTSASFDNPFNDPRNKDNIVAKRGALFMTDLKFAVQERGYTVAHIKTDSIKIPDADEEIIQFVIDFGKRYGYTFEHEATYDRMCLVNDAVYIAKYKDGKDAGKWTATGTQFAVPYVFKTLFSKEDIVFDDLCETKSVSTSLYLDTNEELHDVTNFEKIKALREKRKNESKLSNKELDLLRQWESCSDEELDGYIAEGHNYQFVGRVGNFCPIKEGRGGGLLMREKDGKYYAATGSKGYRWLEAEMVYSLGKEKDIDRSYYDKLVDEAIETISKYGDFEWFVSDDPYEGSELWVDNNIPF